MHEFDRFVRHILKPQAYVRYGDDFVLFFPSGRHAHQARTAAINFLSESLGLTINPKNDVVAASKTGLKFLGHAITKGYAIVDKHTTKSVLNKLDWHNAASYRSLALVRGAKASVDWILLEKYVDI